MRLHRLTISALGPFPGEEVVDFDRLVASGLFLLEGPTGAGKSTVLDAVTFALYGGLAGTSTSRDRLHSDFAEPGHEPRAELEFSVSGVRHRIVRVPPYDRPRRRGSGTTTDPGRVLLERIEADGSRTTLSTRVGETDDEVRRLLGLSRDQFTQVVLLPQGEFARFLQSDAEQRRAVLQRIFRTDHFDRMTQLLADRRREAARAVGAADREVEVAVGAALEAAGADTALRDEVGEYDDAALAAHLEALAADLDAAAAAATAVAEAAQVRVERRRADLDESRRAAAARDRVALLRERERALVAGRPDHEARVAELSAARRAAPVGPLVRALDQAERDLAAADAEAARTRSQLPRAEAQAPDEAALRADERRQVERAAALRPWLEVEAGLQARRAGCDALTQDLASVEEDCRRWQAVLDAAPQRSAELAERLAVAQALAAASGDAEQAATLAHERSLASVAWSAALAEVEAAEQRHRAAADASVAATDAHQDLLQRRLDGIAAELAQGLAPGGACPVCGSLEHPQPARAAADAADAEAVRRAEGVRRSAESDRDRARTALDARREEAQSWRARAAGLDPTAAELEHVRAAQRLSEVVTAAREVERLGAELASVRAETDEARAARDRDQERVATLRARLTAERETLTRDAEDLARTLGGATSVADLLATVQERANAYGRAADAVATRTGRASARDRLRVEAEHEAAAAGFASLAAAAEAVRDPASIESLADAVAAVEQEHAAVLAALADPDLVATAALAVPEPDVAQKALHAAVAELEDEHGRQAVLRQRVAAYDRRRRDVERALRARSEARAAAAPVRRMADVAAGQGANRLRMTLPTYVLRARFLSVVEAGSRRLERMSSGRYSFSYVEEGSGGQRAGLGLAVVDHFTGRGRDTRTLSGGESFYASLALALGLADVVTGEAGGVDLETLFIDEGFGSLDPDTLDQVLDVIDDLRDGGRAVGIVSHVAELKERVPDRLEVRRDARGASHLRLRG